MAVSRFVGFDKAKFLFFGVPGSGKTRLAYGASKLAQMSPVIAFNMTGNPISIRDYPQDQITIVDLDRAKDTNEVERILATAYDFLEKGCPLTSAFARTNEITTVPRTVIFDSLTDLNRVALQELNGVSKLAFGKIPIAEQATLPDYNKLHSYLHAFCRELYSLPFNVIVTCLETYDEKSGMFNVALTGKSASQILSYPYLVGRLTVMARLDEQTAKKVSNLVGDDIKEVRTVLQTNPTLKVQGVKNQYVLDANGFMANPTMESVLSLCKL